jgi:dihydrofolate reductase
MKVILWATVTANGNYARSDEMHPPFQAAQADFGAHAGEAGCFIVGRSTFESFQASGAQVDPDMQIVVLTSHELNIPGVMTAASPQQAIELLESKGFDKVILAGGAKLHNSFLNQNLVDEMLLDIAPVLEDEGYKILLDRGKYQHIELLNSKTLGGGIVQLHYKVAG